jgi:hypothetical protein
MWYTVMFTESAHLDAPRKRQQRFLNAQDEPDILVRSRLQTPFIAPPEQRHKAVLYEDEEMWYSVMIRESAHLDAPRK